jgi:hypothetical protein
MTFEELIAAGLPIPADGEYRLSELGLRPKLPEGEIVGRFTVRETYRPTPCVEPIASENESQESACQPEE